MLNTRVLGKKKRDSPAREAGEDPRGGRLVLDLGIDDLNPKNRNPNRLISHNNALMEVRGRIRG